MHLNENDDVNYLNSNNTLNESINNRRKRQRNICDKLRQQIF